GRSRSDPRMEGGPAAHLEGSSARARTLLLGIPLHLHRRGGKTSGDQPRLVPQTARRHPAAHHRGRRHHHGRGNRRARGDGYARSARNVDLPQGLSAIVSGSAVGKRSCQLSVISSQFETVESTSRQSKSLKLKVEEGAVKEPFKLLASDFERSTLAYD